MPGGNSTARPKNRDERKASEKGKDINRLLDNLTEQYTRGEITQSALRRAFNKLAPEMNQSRKKGVSGPRDKEAVREVNKKSMVGLSKGGMAKKKSGYAKGGMVSCGASMKPGQKRTK
jgi:hypothetical protein